MAKVGIATPKMTSNTTPSGIVSASSIYSTSYNEWEAFNEKNSDSDCWVSQNGSPPTELDPEWLQYQFPAAVTIRAFRFVTRLSGNYTYPKDFILKGSNNGTDWTDLHSVTGLTGIPSGKSSPIYEIATPASYSYYRLHITEKEGNDAWVCVSALHLFQDGWPVHNEPIGIGVPASTFVTASSQYDGNYIPWKAFEAENVDTYTCWVSNAEPTAVSPQWLQMQLSEARTVEFFRFRPRNTTSYDYPKDFVLKGSNNGTDWTDLHSVTGLSGLTYNQYSPIFEIATPASYSYYRLHITDSSSINNWVCVSVFELYGTETPPVKPVVRLHQEVLETVSGGVVDAQIYQVQVEMLVKDSIEAQIFQVQVEMLCANTGWQHSINGVVQPSAVNSVVIPSSVNSVT